MEDLTKYKYVVEYKGYTAKGIENNEIYHVERVTCSKEALQYELREIFLDIEEISGIVTYYDIKIIWSINNVVRRVYLTTWLILQVGIK